MPRPTCPVTDQAVFLMKLVAARTGFDVIPDPTLSGPCAINFTNGVIRINPRLNPDRFHIALARAWLRIMRGPGAAPEFDIPDRHRLHVVRAIPDQRHDTIDFCPHCGQAVGVS